MNPRRDRPAIWLLFRECRRSLLQRHPPRLRFGLTKLLPRIQHEERPAQTTILTSPKCSPMVKMDGAVTWNNYSMKGVTHVGPLPSVARTPSGRSEPTSNIRTAQADHTQAWGRAASARRTETRGRGPREGEPGVPVVAHSRSHPELQGLRTKNHLTQTHDSCNNSRQCHHSHTLCNGLVHAAAGWWSHGWSAPRLSRTGRRRRWRSGSCGCRSCRTGRSCWPGRRRACRRARLPCRPCAAARWRS